MSVKVRLGDLLVQNGLIDESQLMAALAERRVGNGPASLRSSGAGPSTPTQARAAALDCLQGGCARGVAWGARVQRRRVQVPLYM